MLNSAVPFAFRAFVGHVLMIAIRTALRRLSYDWNGVFASSGALVCIREGCQPSPSVFVYSLLQEFSSRTPTLPR